MRLAGLVLGLSLLAGCVAGPAPASREVRVVLYAEPTSLSLIGNTDNNSSQIASLISDGLVAYDAKGAYVPMVARAWEMSPDGLTLTFHLRDGVLWHDGEPVTSRDVAFTWTKVRDPKT
ncbi:MAG TPA: ABC transporter substrate-binding protein, partial [Candidatus Polarisedimenticolaceae bacterium]|nr:ABC transporter substrate-binding protein [Candidatus Polarisedimenticolaceae bacterium]